MVCRKCGNRAESDLCFRCKSSKPLSKGKGLNKKSGNYHPIPDEKKEEALKMKEFFLSVWKKRKHISELSGEILYSPVSSAYFHHIIYKENCKEGKYDEDNIILLSLEEHQNTHSDMHRYEEINKRREKLKIKYNIQ